MNAETLLTHFDRVADAPDAVPRLRRFILALAVRGKLVPQDPNDEPATALLKRIEAEKLRLAKAGEIKKLEAFDPILDEEIPFPIPHGWEIIHMGSLASKLGAGSTPLGGKSVYQSDGVPFLRSQNVYDDGLRLDDVALIPRSVHAKMSGTHIQAQDVLLNITGASIGRCALVPSTLSEGNVSQHVAIIRLFLHDIREFLHLSLISPFYQRMIDDVQVGVSREGLSMQRLRLFPMLLPPLAEQHRIVAKVDELMALCDRLEAAQTERKNQRQRLTAATLHALNNGGDAPAFRDHARFALDHLPHLTTRPEQIAPLRQTILNLAVRGKLVPQDPKDEPAGELLKQILIEKAEARLDSSAVPYEPFPLPDSWLWVCLESLIVFGPQNGLSPKPTKDTTTPRALTLSATTSGRFNPDCFKHVDASSEACEPFWLSPGDLLFQRGNTREYVGIAAIYSGPERAFLFPDLMIRVKLARSLVTRFVHLAVVAPHARKYFSSSATGAASTMPKINQGILSQTPVPLPPLAEQHRIVAKVDELMTLCDRLEAELSAGQTASRRLLEATLHEALSD